MAHLAEIGFEMFEENEDGLKAYVPAKEFTNEMESNLIPDYLNDPACGNYGVLIKIDISKEI